jgi:Protein of unknown function (DUF402)
MNEPGKFETNQHWLSGDTVVVRGTLRGELWWACPQFVVCDSPELIGLYWRAGTPVRRWYRRPTVKEVLNAVPQLVDSAWTDTDVLSLVTPGAAHSIDIMWNSESHELVCWYIQLQQPLRRTQIGFDTFDQILDLVISPNRSEWHWKDEDEFAEAQVIGLYSSEQANAIRIEGQRVIEILLGNQSPFCDGWENWHPPVEWGIPCFPTGWQNVPI